MELHGVVAALSRRMFRWDRYPYKSPNLVYVESDGTFDSSCVSNRSTTAWHEGNEVVATQSSIDFLSHVGVKPAYHKFRKEKQHERINI